MANNTTALATMSVRRERISGFKSLLLVSDFKDRQGKTLTRGRVAQGILGQPRVGRTSKGDPRDHRFLEPLRKLNTGFLDKPVLKVFQVLGNPLVEAFATFAFSPVVIVDQFFKPGKRFC